MIGFAYGLPLIYSNTGASPAPRWVYGQPVLNYEFSQSSGELTATSITTPSPVLDNPALSSGVTDLTATDITLSTPVLGSPTLANVLTVIVVPSRVSGTAPLSVFFDATSSGGLSDPGFFANNAAYMDATFHWNFDQTNVDPDANYRTGSGFLAAHVFENPGTYTVRCTVYDADGNTTYTDTSITVSAFSGTTYYVAADGSDSNPGTMALPFLTPVYALSSTHLAPNVRVLFRNGDTFIIASWVLIQNETGPIIIGGYSDPDSPSVSKPIIHTTAVDTDWDTIYFEGCSDIRIMDIATRATAQSSENPRYPFGIGNNSTCTHMLKYRTVEYQNGGLALSPWGEYNTIAECVFYDTTQTGITGTTEGPNDCNALIGNVVYDKNTVDPLNEEHVFRLQSGGRYYIAHNHFGPNILVSYDSLTIRGNTDKVVVYKNILHGWAQAFRPQNKNSAEEYVHHCIMDSNLIIGQGQYENDRLVAIEIDAKDIVIRNNIIYDYQIGMSITDDTVVGPSQRIKVYNNTFIHPRSSEEFNVILLDAPCSNIDIKNNIVLKSSTPASGSFINITGGTTFNGTSDYNILYNSAWTNSTALFAGNSLTTWRTSTNNDTNSSITDPLFVSIDYNNENFARLKVNSPAVGSGVATPAALDYYGNLRSSNKDIGAVGRPSIVVNHASVDLYDNIPDTYIAEVKKMLFMVRGESHSGAYYAGLNALETLDSKFAYNFNQSGAPEAYTDQYLRHNMYYRFGTSWEQYMGEEEVFTSSTARSSMITGNTYMETNYPDQWIIFGFGWCWDMNWTNDLTTTKDTQYGCGWAGSTSGGPEGNLAWGLNAADFAITGNTVCMDTYINAVRAYNDNFTSAKSIWLYTTGPVDSYSGEAGWQRQVKHDYIRNYVRDNGGVLFDFADILCWTNAGVQNTETWTDGNSVVHTYQNITSESMSGYEGTGYHFGPEGALRLGKAIWVMLAQVAGWVPSNVTELTATGITATAAVLGAPSLTNNTEDSTNCYRWINAELISIEKTSSADVWINGNIVSILEEDSGEMTATGIVASTPVLGTPVLQLNETPLTAEGITSSTPSIGTPALVNYAVLTATEIISSSPVIGTPILQNQLIPSGIVASIPVLGNPAVSINLTAISLVAASPVLGTPAVSINIVPTGIVATSPVLGTPGLVNYAVLTANGITVPQPVLGSPSVDSNTTDLMATGITASAPVLGTPGLGHIYEFGGTADILISGEADFGRIMPRSGICPASTLSSTDHPGRSRSFAEYGNVYVLPVTGESRISSQSGTSDIHVSCSVPASRIRGRSGISQSAISGSITMDGVKEFTGISGSSSDGHLSPVRVRGYSGGSDIHNVDIMSIVRKIPYSGTIGVETDSHMVMLHTITFGGTSVTEIDLRSGVARIRSRSAIVTVPVLDRIARTSLIEGNHGSLSIGIYDRLFSSRVRSFAGESESQIYIRMSMGNCTELSGIADVVTTGVMGYRRKRGGRLLSVTPSGSNVDIERIRGLKMSADIEVDSEASVGYLTSIVGRSYVHTLATLDPSRTRFRGGSGFVSVKPNTRLAVAYSGTGLVLVEIDPKGSVQVVGNIDHIEIWYDASSEIIRESVVNLK